MPKLKKYTQVYGDQSESQFIFDQSILNKNNKNQQERKEESSQKSQAQSSQNKNQISQSQSQKQQKNITGLKDKRSLFDTRKKSTQNKKSKKCRYDADEILKKMRQELAQNQEAEKPDQDETGLYIPDEVLVGFQKKKSKGKKQKSEIKCKNKFFSFQDQSIKQKNLTQQNQLQQLQRLEQQRNKLLQAKASEKTAIMNARKSQIQNKVSKIRGRMQFKNAHEDIRYKQHIKQALQGVKDCENVQIQIEAPKIFKGAIAKHADAALYLKNISQNATPSSQPAEDSFSRTSIMDNKQEKNDKNKNKNIDRKQFYQQFEKQVKQNKTFDLKAQSSGIFKKSSLDQLQSQFQKNQHLFKQQTNSRCSISRLSNKSASNHSKPRAPIQQKSNQKIIQSKIEQRSQISKKYNEQKSKIEPVPEDHSNQDSKNLNSIVSLNVGQDQNKDNYAIRQPLKLNQQKSQQNNEDRQGKTDSKFIQNSKQTSKKKTKGGNNKNKLKDRNKKVRKQIRDLFEQQAQDSQNGYGDDGCSSQSGDEDSVQSLIDRNQVKLIQKHERQARRKYNNQRIKQQQLILQRIKERITAPRKVKCEQNSQSRQRRKRRMDDAKKKFQEEDGNNNDTFADDDSRRNSNVDKEQNVDSFEKQLRNLEEENFSKNPQKQNSKNMFSSAGFQKNKINWKQIKTVNKPSNDHKRGGFSSKDKVIVGSKIASKKSVNKTKNIKF